MRRQAAGACFLLGHRWNIWKNRGVSEASTAAAKPATGFREESCWASLRQGWAPLVLLGLATVLVWGQTVSFGFVWDDVYFIRDFSTIRSLRHLPEMLLRLEGQSAMPEGFILYRPVRTVHYALLCLLGGRELPQPWIYHLANVLWHGATAMMLFAVLRRLVARLQPGLRESEARGWSFLVALAFAVHPVVSEVVCWAKSLDDILAAFFVLAAMRELLKAEPGSILPWRSLAYFAVALYAKESAVPFAVVPLVLYRRVFHRSWKESFRRAAGFAGVAALYVVHRHLVMGRSSQVAPISGSYGQTLLDMLPVGPKYFRLLWGVPPFCIDYSYLKGGGGWSNPEVLFGAVLLGLLVAAGMLSWRWKPAAISGLGLVWLGLFLLPVSNLLPMMQYLAERFLYLPLMGWLAAWGALGLLVARKRVAAVIAGALILVWGVEAWQRSWIWQDAVTLFVRSSRENPKMPRIQQNAVAAILELPQIEKYFAFDPKTKILNVRAEVDAASREGVLRVFAKGYELFPDEPTMVSGYAIGLASCGEASKALPLFQKAARLDPKNAVVLLNSARCAMEAQQFAPAREALAGAAALGPDNPDYLALQLRYDWLTEDFSGARQVLLRLKQIAPSAENDHWLEEVEKKLR